MPDAARLHRGSKLAGRVAVYTHRDPRQVLAQLAGEKIHRVAEIPIYTFDRAIVEDIASRMARRTSWALSVTDREIHLSTADGTFVLPVVEHRIPA